jgi:HK97 family phage major capsid protein
MSMTLEELKPMLEGFRNDIVKTIDSRVKEQSDTANKEIVDLKAKLAEAEKALSLVQEEMKKNKSFGLPGVETEKKNWSWARYFKGLMLNHYAGKNGSHAMAKSFWDGEGSFEQAVCRDYSAADGSSGGFIVPPQIYSGDIVDVVYANTAILKMPGLLKLTGLKSDMPIPVDNGHLTGYDLGETTAPTKSTSSFKLEWLRPKKIGAYARVSNRLLDQTSNAIESIIRNKMTLDLSVHLSNRLTNGIGADSQGKGIMSYYAEMTSVSNLGTNGRRMSVDDLASMKQSLALANELRDTNSYGVIMHPSALYAMLREKVVMFSGQNHRDGGSKTGKLLLDKADIEAALKMKIEDTTQITATNTVGTSTTSSKVVMGDWSKFVYASFRDPIFKVSDVASDNSSNSAFLNDDLLMVMFMEYDCVCLRAAAFTGRDGAETTESSW